MIPATPAAFRLMMDGSAAFTDMEQHGMKIDVDYLDKAIVWTGEKTVELEARLRNDDVFKVWRKRFRSETDLGSRDQLGTVIFTELGYPCYHWTTGSNPRPKTNVEAFEDVDLPFVKTWLDHQKLIRLRTTDLIGTRKLTNSRRILRPSFNMHLASTYRSSSSDPNFHNKPIRDPRLAKLIRRAFIPRSDQFVLGEIDYGAVEFRGAACFWRDPDMVAYASDPTLDIHRDMAAECYMLDRTQVTKATRGMAKNKYVFPTLYGSWWKNTGKDLWQAIKRGELTTVDGVCLYKHLASKGIGDEEQYLKHVKAVAENFSRRFSHWDKEKDVWWESYLQAGEFQLMTGFCCRGVFSYNSLMNTPIQGPSFHLLLWSLIQLNAWLKKHRMKTMLIGQIHDSIFLDIHRKELQDVLNMTEQIMTVAVRKHWDWVITPLEVEVDVSETTWFDKKPWVKCDGVWKSKA